MQKETITKQYLIAEFNKTITEQGALLASAEKKSSIKDSPVVLFLVALSPLLVFFTALLLNSFVPTSLAVNLAISIVIVAIFVGRAFIAVMESQENIEVPFSPTAMGRGPGDLNSGPTMSAGLSAEDFLNEGTPPSPDESHSINRKG